MSKIRTDYSFHRDTIEHLQAQLSSVQEELQRLAAPEANARGTGDVTAAARSAVAQVARLRRPSGPDDGMPTDALHEVVEALISDRPLKLQELVEATGVRQNRISGALVRLGRKAQGRLYRFPVPGSTGRRFRWFLAPAGARARQSEQRPDGDA